MMQQALPNKKMALGRLVLSAREHAVVLMPHGMLPPTLRPAEEIQSDKPYFAEIATAPLNRTMVMLAQRLVEQRVGKLRGPLPSGAS